MSLGCFAQKWIVRFPVCLSSPGLDGTACPSERLCDSCSTHNHSWVSCQNCWFPHCLDRQHIRVGDCTTVTAPAAITSLRLGTVGPFVAETRRLVCVRLCKSERWIWYKVFLCCDETTGLHGDCETVSAATAGVGIRALVVPAKASFAATCGGHTGFSQCFFASCFSSPFLILEPMALVTAS